MRADIENKRTDTDWKRGLFRAGFWKVVIAATDASAALFGVMGAWVGCHLALK